MNFCFEQKLVELKKPVVKNKFSWNMGIYKDSTAQVPEIDLNMNKNTEMKLLTVAAVVGGLLLAVCLYRRMTKMFRS